MGTYINGITLPVPNVDTPSTAANKIVTSFQAIDAHDHTSTNGRPIATAALDIDDDLPVNGYSLQEVKDITLVDNTAFATDSFTLSTKDGELYFRDGNSTNVRVTFNGAVDASLSGGLQGLSGAAGVSYFPGQNLWAMTDESNGKAKLKISDLWQTSANGNTVKVQVDAVVAGGYEVVWPNADHAINQVLMINNASTGQYIWQTVPKFTGSPTIAKFPIFSDTETISASAAATNGQILIGSTSANPVVASISGVTNQVNVTNGAGAITLSLPQSIHTTADVAFRDMSVRTVTATGAVTSGIYISSGLATLQSLTVLNTAGSAGAYLKVDGTGIVSAGLIANSNSSPTTLMSRDGAENTACAGLTCSSITCSGAIDGRDVSADGAVLDSATSSNVGNTIVKRNVSGAFSAGGISCNAINTNGFSATLGDVTAAAIAGTTGTFSSGVGGTTGTFSGGVVTDGSYLIKQIFKTTLGISIVGGSTDNIIQAHGLDATRIVSIVGRGISGGDYVTLPCPSAGLSIFWNATNIKIYSTGSTATWDVEFLILYRVN